MGGLETRPSGLFHTGYPQVLACRGTGRAPGPPKPTEAA